MSGAAQDSEASTPAKARRRPSWPVVVVASLFGLFYAYAVWNAVAFLVSQASGPLGLNGGGWFVLLLPVVFPAVAFAIAYRIGARRRLYAFALVLLAGLAVVAVFWLDIVAYAAVYGGNLLGS